MAEGGARRRDYPRQQRDFSEEENTDAEFEDEEGFENEAARQRRMGEREQHEQKVHESIQKYAATITRNALQNIFKNGARGGFDGQQASIPNVVTRAELALLGLDRFDQDHEGLEAWKTVRLFMKQVYVLFTRIYPRASLNAQRRFFCITLVYGIDRANRAIKTQDDLWITGLGDPGDFYFRDMYRMTDAGMDLAFMEVRGFYYDFLRADHFDPRVEVKIPAPFREPWGQARAQAQDPPQAHQDPFVFGGGQGGAAGFQHRQGENLPPPLVPQPAHQPQPPQPQQQPPQPQGPPAQGDPAQQQQQQQPDPNLNQGPPQPQQGPPLNPDPNQQGQQGQPAPDPQQQQQQQQQPDPNAQHGDPNDPNGPPGGPADPGVPFVPPQMPPPPAHQGVPQQPPVPQQQQQMPQQFAGPAQNANNDGDLINFVPGFLPLVRPAQPNPDPFDLRAAVGMRIVRNYAPRADQQQPAAQQQPRQVPHVQMAPLRADQIPVLEYPRPPVIRQDPGPRVPVHQQRNLQQQQQALPQQMNQLNLGPQQVPLNLARGGRAVAFQTLPAQAPAQWIHPAARQRQQQQQPQPAQRAPVDLSNQRPQVAPQAYARRIDPVTGAIWYTGVEPGFPQDDQIDVFQQEDDPYHLYGSGDQGEDHHQNRLPFPGAGQVYDPPPHGVERVIRRQVPQMPRGPHPLDATMRALDHYGVSPSDPITGVTIGMTSGVAEGIRGLVKDKTHRREYVLETEKPPPANQNLKTDSFDYNIYETNPYKILGERFLKTRFESEGARQAAMRGIFQRVIDDPETLETTRKVALESIGQFDLPRQHGSDTKASAIAAAKLVTEGTYSGQFTHDHFTGTLIDPPVLGPEFSFGPTVLKNIYASMGMPMQEKYSVSDPLSKPLKIFLTPLSSAISENKLNEKAAYSLLMSVLKDEVQEQVRNAFYEDKVPFAETWITLQKTAPKCSASMELQKELARLFEKRPARIETAMARIHMIRTRMCEDYHDPEQRKIFAAQLIVKDFRNLCHKFYPSQASIIDTIFRTKKQSQALERQQKELNGEVCPFIPVSEVNMLKEVISSVLSGSDAITDGPSFLFGGPSLIEDEHQGKTTRKVDFKALDASSTETGLTSVPGTEVVPSQNGGGPQAYYNQGSSRGSRNSRGGRGRAANQGQGFVNQGLQPMVGLPQTTFFPGVTGVTTQTVLAPGTVDQTGRQIVGGQAQMAQVSATQYPGPTYPTQNQDKYGICQVQPRPPGNLFNPYKGQNNGQGRMNIPQVCFDTLQGQCFLCAAYDHWATCCPIYPGLYPIERICPTCGGCHPKECKTPPAGQQQQAQVPQPQVQQQQEYRQPFGNGYGRPGRGRGSFGRGGFGNRFPGGGPRRFNNPNPGWGGGYGMPQQPQQPAFAYPQANVVPQTQNPLMVQAQYGQQQMAPQLPQQQVQQQNPAPTTQTHVPRQGVLGNGGSQPMPDNIFMNPLGAQMGVQALPQAN